MNKKSVILAVNLILFSMSFVLPKNFQQKLDNVVAEITTEIIQEKNNAIIEAIYAADKAGELAQFAQDKYIEILERKNEELQEKKGKKYNGFIAEHSWEPIGTNGLGLDAHGLEFAERKADDLSFVAGSLKYLGYASFMYMLYLPLQNMFTEFNALKSNAPISIADLDKAAWALQMRLWLSTALGFLSMMGRQKVLRIQRDRIIDALIEKNQTIIAQLQEIQRAA